MLQVFQNRGSTHQSTYFIYSFHQVESKFERISGIQQLHQKIDK